MAGLITPSFARWLKAYMPIRSEHRLEWFDRMDNLCELSGTKMSDELEVEVARLFGDKMLRLVENYGDYEPGRLSSDVRASFARVFPKEYLNEAKRLFARSCEVPVLNLFYTTVVLGGGGDTLVAGAFGSTFINDFEGASLASWLQANVIATSGACLDKGDATYSFWVLSAAEPTGWLWDDNPILWTDNGVAVLSCYTTGAFSTNPDSSAWTVLDIETVMGTQTAQGTMPVYSDGGFAALWQLFAVQLGGQNAIGSVIDGTTAVTLTITDTYLPWNANISHDGVNPQTNLYAPCP